MATLTCSAAVVVQNQYTFIVAASSDGYFTFLVSENVCVLLISCKYVKRSKLYAVLFVYFILLTNFYFPGIATRTFSKISRLSLSKFSSVLNNRCKEVAADRPARTHGRVGRRLVSGRGARPHNGEKWMGDERAISTHTPS
jgi:hypothetical protein